MTVEYEATYNVDTRFKGQITLDLKASPSKKVRNLKLLRINPFCALNWPWLLFNLHDAKVYPKIKKDIQTHWKAPFKNWIKKKKNLKSARQRWNKVLEKSAW